MTFPWIDDLSWQRELALSVLVVRLQNGADEATRRGVVEAHRGLIFPEPGSSVGQTMWKTYRNVTRVTLWGRDHFINDVRLALVVEALDLGPRFYCVMRTPNRDFTERLYLLSQFLPTEKICLYPNFMPPLRGIFDRSVHASGIGAAIYRRILPFEERPNMCPACDSCFCDHVMEELTDL